MKFDKNYYNLYSQFPDTTQQQVDTFLRVCQPKETVLDIGCGYGRHAIELAKRGYKVTGVDSSSYLLGLISNKEKLTIVHADIRNVQLGRYDAIASFFTSFGYNSDEDNEKIIQNVARWLHPKGRFFLDLTNPSLVIPGKTTERVGDLLVTTTTDVVNKRWKMKREWTGGSIESDIRLYSPEEIIILLEKYVRVIDTLDSYDGIGSRLIIVAEK